MTHFVLYSFQKLSYSSLLIFLIMSSVLRTSFFLITFSSLFCCSVSRDTLRGRSSLSTYSSTQGDTLLLLCIPPTAAHKGTHYYCCAFLTHIHSPTNWQTQNTISLLHLYLNPLGPRSPITTHSFALLRNPGPPGSGRLADAPY